MYLCGCVFVNCAGAVGAKLKEEELMAIVSVLEHNIFVFSSADFRVFTLCYYLFIYCLLKRGSLIFAMRLNKYFSRDGHFRGYTHTYIYIIYMYAVTIENGKSARRKEKRLWRPLQGNCISACIEYCSVYWTIGVVKNVLLLLLVLFRLSEFLFFFFWFPTC